MRQLLAGRKCSVFIWVVTTHMGNTVHVCTCVHLCKCEFLLKWVFKACGHYVHKTFKNIVFKDCWYSYTVAMFKRLSLFSIFLYLIIYPLSKKYRGKYCPGGWFIKEMIQYSVAPSIYEIYLRNTTLKWWRNGIVFWKVGNFCSFHDLLVVTLLKYKFYM